MKNLILVLCILFSAITYASDKYFIEVEFIQSFVVFVGGYSQIAEKTFSFWFPTEKDVFDSIEIGSDVFKSPHSSPFAFSGNVSFKSARVKTKTIVKK